MKKLLLSLIAGFVAVAANAWTVTYTNPENWEKVYAYTYSEETLGKWPGPEMTKDGAVWTISGEGVSTNIIFNNGESGDANQTNDLVFSDGTKYTDPSKQTVAEETEEPELTAPDALYILGNIEGADWSDSASPEMTSTKEGVFTISNITLTAETSYFSFASKIGSWNDINSNRYVPAADRAITLGVASAFKFYLGVGDDSWSVDGGTYDFTVDFNEGTIMVTEAGSGAVHTIGAELNGEEVIYNLQGVRVNRNNMPAGIYIINGKKVAVK